MEVTNRPIDAVKVVLLDESTDVPRSADFHMLFHDADPTTWSGRVAEELQEFGIRSGSWFVRTEHSTSDVFPYNPVIRFHLTPAVGPASGPAAGAEESLGRAEQAWKNVVVTSPYEGVTKRMLPVFYAKETLSALAVAGKAGPVLVLAASQAGAEEVRVFLERLAIPADRYQIWRVDGEDQLSAALARAEQQFSGRFHVYLVNPARADWLKELLAGLEEQGNLPVGDLGPAVQAAQEYFQFV